jgi:hypothetical protein
MTFCRIIWDEQEVVNRIWDRCLSADGVGKELESQPRAVECGEKWRMVRVNERMRFLKYGAGNYFKS